jgi:TolB-like protein/Flp pilus assembly protein TadD
MSPAVVEAEASRRQLDRVLASPGFTRNERLARFLKFVLERHLEGRDSEIKESVLAVEVFGRGSDHDPKQDSIVRTEAARLRARLAEYYLGEGKQDDIVIELPKGGYVPFIRRCDPPAAPEPLEQNQPGLWSGQIDRNWRRAGFVLGVLGLAAVGWWRWQQHNAPITIAVLPLINLTQDPARDFFADAITGELIRDLSILDGLVVRSQTSSFVFKGKSAAVGEAGKELNVDYILEGSVMRSDDRLRINAQLVRVRDDMPVWSGQYEREVADIFAIQDEISRGIVNSLRLKLGRGRRRYETSMDAYDLYLEARAMEVQKPAQGENYSAGLYEQAIAKDSSFAPAYAALGAAYAYRSGEDRMNAWAKLDRSEEIARMRTVVAKAIELDPLLAEAHSALGTVQARDGQWKNAEQSFRRALELEPNLSVIRKNYVLSILWPLGRLTEALEQVHLAEKNDPLARDLQQLDSDILFAQGRFDEAARHCESPCPRALILEGKAAEAIPILEQRFSGRLQASGSGILGLAYALEKRRDDAEKVAEAQPRPSEEAEIFLALGDNSRALDALERMVPMNLGPARIGRTLTRPELAALRAEPRIEALRKKVGLPE